MVKQGLKYGIGAFAAVLIISQFIQPERTNPPADPSASFEAVAKPPREVATAIGRACRDCHSNNTVWPWYSRLSPVSWLVASDVTKGRAKLNFSQWSIYSQEMSRIKLGEICDEVKKAEMPPQYYVPMHPETNLTQRRFRSSVLLQWHGHNSRRLSIVSPRREARAEECRSITSRAGMRRPGAPAGRQDEPASGSSV